MWEKRWVRVGLTTWPYYEWEWVWMFVPVDENRR
jgi:hypothetical protein